MLTETTDTPQPINKPQLLRRKILVFFLGALCFLVTQVFTRVPLLGWLQGEPGFILWAMSKPLLSGILIALTAGIFEESGRFAFKALALKPVRTQIWEPIVFGLGHGLCEVVWIFSMVWGTVGVLEPSQLVLPVVERLLAVTMHVSFSVMIWNGFQLDQRVRYLVLAILVHGAVDALIPLARVFGWGVMALEGIFAGIAGLLLIYTIYSKRYYRREDSHE
jgi:uncharacterized membrane protein YhfC